MCVPLAWSLIAVSMLLLPMARARMSAEQAQPAATSPAAKAIGLVKSVSGNGLVLATETGSSITVVVVDSTRLVRVAPGQKDLKDAAPAQLSDVHSGDRMLVKGNFSDDGKNLTASLAVLMKQEDVAAKRERDRQDWQKRGLGGLVGSVDMKAGTVAITTRGLSGAQTVSVQISKDTVIRRYARDSVKFDDATAATLDQIKPGDQLRARGTRNADGTQMAADEIVSGTFRNIAGTVAAVNGAAGTVTVLDLVTNKPVTLKVSSDSQLRKLPEMMAQRVAARLKGGTGGDTPPAPQNHPTGSSSDAASADASSSDGAGRRPHANGPPDFQQMLARMPAVALTELQKGDAVMLVSTEGGADAQPIAITLLTGVEPILAAAPNRVRAAMLLSPWNLSGGGEESGGATP